MVNRQAVPSRPPSRPPSRAPTELRRPSQDTRTTSLPPGTTRQQTPAVGGNNGFDPRTRFLDPSRAQRRQIRLLPGNRPRVSSVGPGYRSSVPQVSRFNPASHGLPYSSHHFQANGQYYSSQPTHWYEGQPSQDSMTAVADQEFPMRAPASLHSQPPRFNSPVDQISALQPSMSSSSSSSSSSRVGIPHERSWSLPLQAHKPDGFAPISQSLSAPNTAGNLIKNIRIAGRSDSHEHFASPEIRSESPAGQSAVIDPIITGRKISRPASHCTATPVEISQHNEKLMGSKAFEFQGEGGSVEDEKADDKEVPVEVKRKPAFDATEGKHKRTKLTAVHDEHSTGMASTNGSCACKTAKYKCSISPEEAAARLSNVSSTFSHQFEILASTGDATAIIQHMKHAIENHLKTDDYKLMEQIAQEMFVNQVVEDQWWALWGSLFEDKSAEESV
ncbi:hypothetical protein BJ166DRAFT_171391 [Pestalotiopsis sp. NC0098]|nr:hypothetical protein BJ166DRAFT_171391 [Pestalotiopsis sp. NC0098]